MTYGQKQIIKIGHVVLILVMLSLYLVCPDNIPLVTCNGDPCEGASCPGYPSAVCVADYCGHCQAVWYVGQDIVTCTG